MTTIQLSHCRVEIEPERDFLVTIFPDGSRCEASPHDTDEYRRTAQELGYGDDNAGLMRCCLEHEIGHSLLAENNGEPYSRTLWDVAHGITGAPHHPDANSDMLDIRASLCGKALIQYSGWCSREESIRILAEREVEENG